MTNATKTTSYDNLVLGDGIVSRETIQFVPNKNKRNLP
jgi:hypothetical protein